jgi:copper chaperone
MLLNRIFNNKGDYSVEKIILNVVGMSCSHCENAVKKAVGALKGVKEVVVSLEKKTVIVGYEHSELSVEEIKNAIEDQGYDVK